MVIHIIICDDRLSPPGGVKLCSLTPLTRWTTPWRGGRCWERVNCTSRNFPARVSIDPEPKAKPALPSRANRLSAWPCSGTRRCLRVQLGITTAYAVPQAPTRAGALRGCCCVVRCSREINTSTSTRKVVGVVDRCRYKIILSVYPWQPASATRISCATPVPLPSVN